MVSCVCIGALDPLRGHPLRGPKACDAWSRQLTLRPSSAAPTVIIPQAPFGMPKYDNGERWDLKAKYTDEGYEDADADVMGKFMALFKPKGKGKDGDK